MKLPDMLWTRGVLDMARNKDVDGLLKKGFYVICFKEDHVNVQGDLEDVGISETEFAEYKYLQTTSVARFYDYTWKGGCITLCTSSSINSADVDIKSAFE
ncbi:hypothetical protein KAU11_00380 [Candidatus Babeliales bacterium]|nr:hypothetical protein [Candidatus Babeliales bacterium]